MMSVVLFEAREVTFKAIAAWWDVRAIEVAKHVGKGSEKHAACSFEIAENPASFRELSNALAVPIFPFEYLRT